MEFFRNYRNVVTLSTLALGSNGTILPASDDSWVQSTRWMIVGSVEMKCLERNLSIYHFAPPPPRMYLRLRGELPGNICLIYDFIYFIVNLTIISLTQTVKRRRIWMMAIDWKNVEERSRIELQTLSCICLERQRKTTLNDN